MGGWVYTTTTKENEMDVKAWIEKAQREFETNAARKARFIWTGYVDDSTPDASWFEAVARICAAADEYLDATPWAAPPLISRPGFDAREMRVSKATCPDLSGSVTPNTDEARWRLIVRTVLDARCA